MSLRRGSCYGSSRQFSMVGRDDALDECRAFSRSPATVWVSGFGGAWDVRKTMRVLWFSTPGCSRYFSSRRLATECQASMATVMHAWVTVMEHNKGLYDVLLPQSGQRSTSTNLNRLLGQNIRFAACEFLPIRHPGLSNRDMLGR